MFLCLNLDCFKRNVCFARALFAKHDFAYSCKPFFLFHLFFPVSFYYGIHFWLHIERAIQIRNAYLHFFSFSYYLNASQKHWTKHGLWWKMFAKLKVKCLYNELFCSYSIHNDNISQFFPGVYWESLHNVMLYDCF